MWKEPGRPKWATPRAPALHTPCHPPRPCSQWLVPRAVGTAVCPALKGWGQASRHTHGGSSSAPPNRARGAADRAGPPTPLAPGEGGMGRALGPSRAHGKCPEMVCPAAENWSIAAALGAPAEDRVAEGPWAAADSPQDTALPDGRWTEVGPGGSASRPAELGGGSLWMMSRPPTGDRTSVARGSSSQACSGSPVVPPAAEGWNPPRLRGAGAVVWSSVRSAAPGAVAWVTAHLHAAGHGPQSPCPGTSAQLRARRHNPRRGAGRRTPAVGTGAEMLVGARPRLLSHAVPQGPCFRPRPS